MLITIIKILLSLLLFVYYCYYHHHHHHHLVIIIIVNEIIIVVVVAIKHLLNGCQLFYMSIFLQAVILIYFLVYRVLSFPNPSTHSISKPTITALNLLLDTLKMRFSML